MTCSTASYAASFDCAKANAKYEKTICSDGALNILDEALSNNYRAVMNFNREQKVKDRLKQDQIAWLNKRNSCDEYQCIRGLYEWRVDEICENYGSFTKKSSCISTQDTARQANKEREVAQSERTIEEALQYLAVKHDKDIYDLSFSTSQLNSIVYTRPS
ncbi:hypothetical protein CS369_18465 [Candidatus Symbiopectobacterium sp. 'North America']|nr:hypothetical protein [Candidatus Symbiopectobacterium sp. 'North America']